MCLIHFDSTWISVNIFFERLYIAFYLPITEQKHLHKLTWEKKMLRELKIQKFHLPTEVPRLLLCFGESGEWEKIVRPPFWRGLPWVKDAVEVGSQIHDWKLKVKQNPRNINFSSCIFLGDQRWLTLWADPAACLLNF